MSTISRMTAFQIYEHRVTCPISSVNPPPKTCTRFQNPTVCTVIPHNKPFSSCHMSTGSRVTPSKYLHLDHMSRVSLMTPLQDSVSGVTFSVSRVNSLPNPAHGVTSLCLQADCTSPEAVPWITCPVSRVTPAHQNFYLWSHLHSLRGDHHSKTLNIWSHVHSLQGDTTKDAEPVVTHP